MREDVGRLYVELSVYRTRSMREVVTAFPGVPVAGVLTTTLMGFAFLAVVLRGIGLFGLVAHDVA